MEINRDSSVMLDDNARLWYINLRNVRLGNRESAVTIATIATGWKTEGSEFESRESKEFLLLHVVETGFGVHPVSYPMYTGGSFLGGKAAGA
jgi:hypothetical protein